MSDIHILKVSRLEGLYDGIFAIAMTILALDLKLPAGLSTYQVTSILTSDVIERLFIYMGSFIILGTLWIAMTFQLGLLQRLNRPYLWTNVLYLMIICIVPFSASLVGSFPIVPASIIFYAINLLCASCAQAIIAETACYYGLNNTTIYTGAIRIAVLRRIAVAPAFYIVSIFLAYTNPRLAFVALVAPTLIYIIPGRVDKYS